VLISPAATFVHIWAFYLHLAFPYKIGYTLRSNRIIFSGFNWIWRDFPRDAVLRRYVELARSAVFLVTNYRRLYTATKNCAASGLQSCS
jgi:hypothetical protein